MRELVLTRHNELIDPLVRVWGWEIPVYLFLGGWVAGMMILVGYFLLRGRNREDTCVCSVLPGTSFVLLSLGMGALFLDLEHKLYVWRLYTTFEVTSPMSWGAWILVLIYPAGLLFGLGSLDAAQRAWLGARTPAFLRGPLARLTDFAGAHRRAILVTSVLMGVGLGLYTGLLLGTMPSRLAWNSAVVGPLFLASGVSTGAASLLLLRLDEAERKFLVRWDAVAIGAELVLIVLLLLGWATSGEAGRLAARSFLGGPYTAVFWSLVVVVGLLVPLAMELLESRRHLPFVALVPVLILAGGLALRWILLAAGQASAFRLLP